MHVDQNCADKGRKLHPSFVHLCQSEVESFVVANVSIGEGRTSSIR